MIGNIQEQDYYTKDEVDQMLLEKINREDLDLSFLSLVNNKLTLTNNCIINSKLNPNTKSLELPTQEEATNNKLTTELAVAIELNKKIKKTDIFSINSVGYNSWKNLTLNRI